MHAKLGIGFGTHPGYCKTWITGVTWHSSAALEAWTADLVNRGSKHILANKNVIAVRNSMKMQWKILIKSIVFMNRSQFEIMFIV